MLEGFKEGEWVTGVEAIGEEPPKLPVIAQMINTCDHSPSLIPTVSPHFDPGYIS